MSIEPNPETIRKAERLLNQSAKLYVASVASFAYVLPLVAFLCYLTRRDGSSILRMLVGVVSIWLLWVIGRALHIRSVAKGIEAAEIVESERRRVGL